MKSHPNAGQFNLRGKRSMTLPCGCCDAFDKRVEHERAAWRRTLADQLNEIRSEQVDSALPPCSSDQPDSGETT